MTPLKAINTENRQKSEFFQWPELSKQFQDIAELVMVSANNLTRQLRSRIIHDGKRRRRLPALPGAWRLYLAPDGCRS